MRVDEGLLRVGTCPDFLTQNKPIESATWNPHNRQESTEPMNFDQLKAHNAPEEERHVIERAIHPSLEQRGKLTQDYTVDLSPKR